MRLLEHEAKEIMGGYGIDRPPGELVSSPEEVETDGPVMVKAQIPVGGRGKAGAVLEAHGLQDTREKVARLLAAEFKGYRAKRVLVEAKAEVEREFFLGLTYDGVAKAPVAVFSGQGGVDIEDLAARHPDRVRMEPFSIRSGLAPHRAREIVSELDVSGRLLLSLGDLFSRLGSLFLDLDATVAEINPLALTRQGALLALDGHLEIDDDAMFRHGDLGEKARDPGRFEGGRRATPFERKAAEIDGLDHRGVAGRVIEFPGELGVIIGGGGASLTAFDAIRHHGGRPANYCEIGGNPSVLKVKELTKHILSRPDVKKIAVIMNVVSNTRVDLVARGVIKGILEAGRKPSETVAVFRIPGAWEQEGFKILSKYGVEYCDRSISIDQAAKIAVERV